MSRPDSFITQPRGPAASPEATVAAALAYAGRGWPVFPCKPGSKQPATPHGFKDATTDPGRIRAWWQRHPHANLAIATGAPGPDVLDVDQHGPAGNGYAALNQINRAGLLNGASAIVATPSGGLHLYYAGSNQPSGSLRARHLDFKATGGYVLAPPSVVSGKPYRLVGQHTRPGSLEWQAVTSLLEPSKRQPGRSVAGRPGDLDYLVAWVERLQEGNRNAGLFWAACRAVETGHEQRLRDLAAAAIRTGLDQREIARTIDAQQSATAAVLRIDANGTMWRLRSLVAMGHDATRIASALGITDRTARRLITGDTATISPDLNDLAQQLWDAWWDKHPPEDTSARRRAASVARLTARQNSWPTPAALDEDILDQPGYRPYSIWRSASGTGTAPDFPPADPGNEPPAPLAAVQQQERQTA
jgi:hypothetical protein